MKRLSPIVIIEATQSLPGLTKLLGFIFLFAGVGCLVIGPGSSAPIAWFVVLPNFALALGVGLFQEEYEKGQLRYLWGWPIHRRALFGVKVLSGLITLGCAAALMALIFAGWPDAWRLAPRAAPGGTLNQIATGPNVTRWGGAALVTAQTFYALAAGALAMSACRHGKYALWLCMPLMYLSLGALAAALFYGRGELGLMPVAGVIAVAGGLLLAGAYGVYRRRNPFLEQIWTWRIHAVIPAFFSAAVLIGGLALLAGRIEGGSWALLQLVPPAQLFAAPDRPRLLAVTYLDGTPAASVIDLDGETVATLPDGLIPVYGNLAWRPLVPGTAFGLLMQRQPAPEPSVRFPTVETVLVEPDTGHVRLLWPVRAADDAGERADEGNRVDWQGWTPDGRHLIGQLRSRDGDRTELLFLDVENGDVVRAPLKAQGESVRVLPSGRVAAQSYAGNPSAADKTEGPPPIRLFTAGNPDPVIVQLPPDNAGWVATTEPARWILLQRSIEGDAVVQRLVRFDPDRHAETPWSGGPDLPSLTLDEMLHQRGPTATLFQENFNDGAYGYPSARTGGPSLSVQRGPTTRDSWRYDAARDAFVTRAPLPEISPPPGSELQQVTPSPSGDRLIVATRPRWDPYANGDTDANVFAPPPIHFAILPRDATDVSTATDTFSSLVGQAQWLNESHVIYLYHPGPELTPQDLGTWWLREVETGNERPFLEADRAEADGK